MPSWPCSLFTPQHIIATHLMTSLRPISSLPHFHFLLSFYYFALRTHRRRCSHLKWNGNKIRRRAHNCVVCNLENYLSIREWVAKKLWMPGTFERSDASRAQWLYGAVILHTHSVLWLAQPPYSFLQRQKRKRKNNSCTEEFLVHY